MKLQPESKKELLRIACGVSLCTAVMWVVFAALHLVGWVVFDYRVLLGGIIGALVAIGNFAGICFVVQKVIDETGRRLYNDHKLMFLHFIGKGFFLCGFQIITESSLCHRPPRFWAERRWKTEPCFFRPSCLAFWPTALPSQTSW